jgi:hypothetical protein
VRRRGFRPPSRTLLGEHGQTRWGAAASFSENFEIIPLCDVYIEVVVNPKIVDDWAFSGWDGGDIGHTWRITACKQKKPCVK